MARIYLEKEKEKNSTVLGRETVFTGVLEFTDNLKITGRFEGTIHASGALIVDKAAVCNVDQIRASSITVEGKVTGDLEASDRVEMRSGSEIRGNVVTSRLRIADGVIFDGDVTMLRTESTPEIFSSSVEELKQTLRAENESTAEVAAVAEPSEIPVPSEKNDDPGIEAL